MKKSILWMSAAAIALLTSCSQDETATQSPSGDTAQATISFELPTEDLATRGAALQAAAFTDPVCKDINVTLMVSYNGIIVHKETKTAQDMTNQKVVTFEARLVKSKAYDISAWADFGQGYYQLTDVGAAPSVKLTDTALKNYNSVSEQDYNKFDAYFGNLNVTLTKNESFTIVLRRPFALVKIHTLDWDEPAVKNAGLQPTHYSTTFHAPTELNLITGVASNEQDIAVSALISDGGIVAEYHNTKELTFDYLFAHSESSILPDFTVDYMQGQTKVCDYTYQNIPVRRNYKTIIYGNVLTKLGTINVMVDSTWNNPSKEIIIKEVANFSAAMADLSNNRSEIRGTEYYIADVTPNDSTFTIPSNTKGGAIILDMANFTTGSRLITVKDASGTGRYNGVVIASIPVRSDKQFIFQLPEAKVVVVGDYVHRVYVKSQGFYVDTRASINDLYVRGGDVTIYGTVNSIKRLENTDAETNVYLKRYYGDTNGVWTNKATEAIAPFVLHEDE